MYDRDYCDTCIRCNTTEGPLQYDNSLGSAMCGRCWKLATKTHQTCWGCGEWLLVTGSKEEKKWNSIKDAPCLGGEFSRFHPEQKDKVVCTECDEELLKEEKKKEKKEEREKERSKINVVNRKRSRRHPSLDEEKEKKEEGEVDDDDEHPSPSKKLKATTMVMLVSNGIDSTVIVQ